MNSFYESNCIKVKKTEIAKSFAVSEFEKYRPIQDKSLNLTLIKK